MNMEISNSPPWTDTTEDDPRQRTLATALLLIKISSELVEVAEPLFKALVDAGSLDKPDDQVKLLNSARYEDTDKLGRHTSRLSQLGDSFGSLALDPDGESSHKWPQTVVAGQEALRDEAGKKIKRTFGMEKKTLSMIVIQVKRAIYLDALIREPMQYYEKHPLFSECNKTDIERVALATKVKVLEHSATVCELGEPVDFVYFVKGGQLKVREAMPGAEPTESNGTGARPGTGILPPGVNLSPEEEPPKKEFKPGEQEKNRKRRKSIALVGPGDFLDGSGYRERVDWRLRVEEQFFHKADLVVETQRAEVYCVSRKGLTEILGGDDSGKLKQVIAYKKSRHDERSKRTERKFMSVKPVTIEERELQIKYENMEGGHPSIETMIRKGMQFPGSHPGFGESASQVEIEEANDYSFKLPHGLSTGGSSGAATVLQAASSDLTRHLQMAEYRPISNMGIKDPWTGYRKKAIGEMVAVVEHVMYADNMNAIEAYNTRGSTLSGMPTKDNAAPLSKESVRNMDPNAKKAFHQIKAPKTVSPICTSLPTWNVFDPSRRRPPFGTTPTPCWPAHKKKPNPIGSMPPSASSRFRSKSSVGVHSHQHGLGQTFPQLGNHGAEMMDVDWGRDWGGGGFEALEMDHTTNDDPKMRGVPRPGTQMNHDTALAREIHTSAGSVMEPLDMIPDSRGYMPGEVPNSNRSANYVNEFSLKKGKGTHILVDNPPLAPGQPPPSSAGSFHGKKPKKIHGKSRLAINHPNSRRRDLRTATGHSYGVFFDTRQDHHNPKFECHVKEPMNSTIHLLGRNPALNPHLHQGFREIKTAQKHRDFKKRMGETMPLGIPVPQGLPRPAKIPFTTPSGFGLGHLEELLHSGPSQPRPRRRSAFMAMGLAPPIGLAPLPEQRRAHTSMQ